MNGTSPQYIVANFSDFNFVRQDGECVPVGPEPVPAGTCQRDNDKYLGSSGYRKIPGNGCVQGVKLDEKVEKDCTNGELPPYSCDPIA